MDVRPKGPASHQWFPPSPSKQPQVVCPVQAKIMSAQPTGNFTFRCPLPAACTRSVGEGLVQLHTVVGLDGLSVTQPFFIIRDLEVCHVVSHKLRRRFKFAKARGWSDARSGPSLLPLSLLDGQGIN